MALGSQHPETDLTVIVLDNIGNTASAPLREKLVAVTLGDNVDLPADHK
ncbi:MAG TPA: hypothetical protein VG839_00375 [Asticcacaulis sp.]|nr:hypothetical protein [Asticcacaulis sp.]